MTVPPVWVAEAVFEVRYNIVHGHGATDAGPGRIKL